MALFVSGFVQGPRCCGVQLTTGGTEPEVLALRAQVFTWSLTYDRAPNEEHN